MKFYSLRLTLIILCCKVPCLYAEPVLLLDLDASKGLEVNEDGLVAGWKNQVEGAKAQWFRINDAGKRAEKKGSGMPQLKTNLAGIKGKSALSFRNDELINIEEDVFDGLTTGMGHTWMVVLQAYETDKNKTELGQKPLKNVNSFIGNLKNGAKFCGFWGCFNDDLTVWIGARNDLTFGRFDKNNPQLKGPRLEANKFYIIASRLQAGHGEVKAELFVDSIKPVATAMFPINKEANPSKLAIGTERDAIEHPGVESFDGAIAKVLIYEGAMSDEQLGKKFAELKASYGLE